MRLADFDAQLGRPTLAEERLAEIAAELDERLAEIASPWLYPQPHLSATQLNMLQRCPRQYQCRYVLGLKEAPGAAKILGSAFHGAHEHNWVQKIESHEDVPTEEISEYFNDVAWPAALDDAGGTDEIKWDGKPEDARALGDRMVTVYRNNVSPRIQPIAVEQRIEHDIGLPVPLIGYLDVITDGPTVDTKTSSKKVTKPKADWRLQGKVYRVLHPAPVDWHVITKAKEPTTWTPLEAVDLHTPLSHLENAQTVEHIKRLVALANYYMHTYGPDEPWPATGVGHDWACDWCAYKVGCPAWHR